MSKNIIQADRVDLTVSEIQEAGFVFNQPTGYHMESLLSNPISPENRVNFTPPVLTTPKLRVGEENGIIEESPTTVLPEDLVYPLDRDLKGFTGKDFKSLQDNFSYQAASKLHNIPALETTDVNNVGELLDEKNLFLEGAVATRKPNPTLIKYKAGEDNWFSYIHRGSICNLSSLKAYRYTSNPIAALDEIVLKDTGASYATVFAAPVSLSKASNVCISCYAQSKYPTELYGLYLVPATEINKYIQNKESGDFFKLNEKEPICVSKNTSKQIAGKQTYFYNITSCWERYYKTNRYEAGNYYAVIYWPSTNSNSSANRSTELSLAGLYVEAANVPSIYDSRYVINNSKQQITESMHPLFFNFNLENKIEWAIVYNRLIYSHPQAGDSTVFFDSIGDAKIGYRGNNIIIGKQSYPFIDSKYYFNQWETVSICKKVNTPALVQVFARDGKHSYSYSIPSLQVNKTFKDVSYNLLLGTTVLNDSSYNTSNGFYKDLQVTTPSNLERVIKERLRFTRVFSDGVTSTALITPNLKEI